MTPQHKQPKEKMDKLDFIKIKHFYMLKETIKKGKRKHTKWENISASHLSDNGLVFKIYKELLQLNIKKLNKPSKNG